MSLNFRARVSCTAHNCRYIHRLSSFGRKSVALLLPVVLIFATIPLVSAQSLIRIAKNSALPNESSKSRPTTRASLQGNSQNRGMPPLPVNAPGVTPGRPLTKQEKEAKVQKVKINPHDEVTLQLGQQAVFSAVPLDQDGNTIHGLTAAWESTDPQILSITAEGDAVAAKIGSTVVTVTVANKKEKVKVNVGPRKKATGSSLINEGEPFVDNGSLTMPEATKRPPGSKGLARISRRGRASMKSHISSTRFAPVLIDDDALASRYYASNAVGTPPGKTTPGASVAGAATASTETPGSSNFSFGLPIVNLPGRNLDLNLGLIYNSRLWTKYIDHLNQLTMTYNVNEDWPAPGFRLGFGSWISNYSADPRYDDGRPRSGTLIDADGTRHQMVDTSHDRLNPNCIYNSTDGTFIHAAATNCGGSVTVTYPGGIQARFDVDGAGPSRITDQNGNYILISYDQFNGLISTIRDTLGRLIHFSYNYNASTSRYELTSITAPPFNGQGPDREVARFYYRDLSLQSGLFLSSAIVGAPQSVRLISDIYFPKQRGIRRCSHRLPL